MKNIYVNYPEKSPNFSTLSEAFSYLSKEDTPATASYPAPVSDLESITLHIAPGIYRERLVLERPNVTLVGENAASTIIVYGDYAKDTLENGERRGTFRTATLRIHTHDVTMKNLTVQNDSGCGYLVGQALALYVDGDRNSFYNLRLIGSQDTLFTAPLPHKEAQPGGFNGPGKNRPRTMGRHYYKDCFIQGDVDFIFGGACCFFESCTLFSKKPQEYPPEAEGREIFGYVTAASTFQEQPYGYVFSGCRLTGDCPPETVYLGRPWREYAKTVFINCELGAHIKGKGWTDWEKPHGHFFYAEYNSVGEGACVDMREDYSHQLSEEDAALYTKERVLQGWMPAE